MLTETSIFEIRAPAVAKFARFCIYGIDTHFQYWENSIRLDRSDTAMHAVESLGGSQRGFRAMFVRVSELKAVVAAARARRSEVMASTITIKF